MQDILSPLLQQAIGIGDGALEEYWQQFEVLRLAYLTAHSDRFEEQVAKVQKTKDRLDSFADDQASEEKSQAWEDYSRARGVLARLVAVGPVRVFVRDTYGFEWRAPAADDLADVVATDQHHPLITALSVSSATAEVSLRTVSIALGMRGAKDEDRWLDQAGGIQTHIGRDQCWLDDKRRQVVDS